VGFRYYLVYQQQKPFPARSLKVQLGTGWVLDAGFGTATVSLAVLRHSLRTEQIWGFAVPARLQRGSSTSSLPAGAGVTGRRGGLRTGGRRCQSCARSEKDTLAAV